MIFREDDFLSPDLFDMLSKKTTQLYKMSKPEFSTMDVSVDDIDPDRGIYNKNQAVQEAMRFRFWCNGDDVMKETVEFFGPNIEKILLQVKNYLIDKGWTNIKLSNIWFQYGDTETQMHRHSDGTIHDATFENCFTSMIFAHPEWKNDWGGQFKVESMDGTETTIQNPDPNSFIIWSRNHPHWMTPIVKECPLRMFIGMSWYQKEERHDI
jgi:hypothetical protein